MTYPHIPILVPELLSFFQGKEIHTFVDATLGAGGHSHAILEAHPEIELLIGIDQDQSALAIASERLHSFSSKIALLHGNFEDIDTLLAPFGSKEIDGIFADLGVSSMQLDTKERGFSFSKNGPLDMRMNPNIKTTAKEIVNTWPKDDLEMIFKEYGEEPRWRLVAKAILDSRQKAPLETTEDLLKAITPALRPYIPGKIHPATLTFQAIRIAVNRELEVIEQFLPKAFQLLAPMGRFGILSFHSLEDRIVKNFFRQISGYRGGREHGDNSLPPEDEAIILTKKPITPGNEEININPRSRSAKLRFVEKRI